MQSLVTEEIDMYLQLAAALYFGVRTILCGHGHLHLIINNDTVKSTKVVYPDLGVTVA